MKNSTRLIAVVLVAVFALAALAACADKNDVTAKVIEIELTDEDYAFGVDKDQPELLE